MMNPKAKVFSKTRWEKLKPCAHMRLSYSARRIPSAPSQQNLGFPGFYYLIVEPIVSHSRGKLMEAARTKSLQPLIRLARYIRYILRPNSSCSVCGRRVREYWIPRLSCVVDDGVVKTLKLLEPVHIECQFCDPFLVGLREEQKRSASFYVV